MHGECTCTPTPTMGTERHDDPAAPQVRMVGTKAEVILRLLEHFGLSAPSPLPSRLLCFIQLEKTCVASHLLAQAVKELGLGPLFHQCSAPGFGV